MPREQRGEPSVRLNLEIRPEVKRMIVDLTERTGSETMTETIRKALRIYEQLLDALGDDAVLIVRNTKTGEEEKVILIGH